MGERGRVEHLNPEELPQNPGYTQVVTVTGPAKTVYVGGQNAVTASNEVVGKGDVAAQTEQIFRGMRLLPRERISNTSFKWHVNVVEGQPIQPGFEVFQREWGHRPNPPIVTVAVVSGLADPDFLVEIDAVAIVPE